MKDRSAISISKATLIAIHKITTQIVIGTVVTVAVQRARARLAGLSIIFVNKMIWSLVATATARTRIIPRMRTATKHVTFRNGLVMVFVMTTTIRVDVTGMAEIAAAMSWTFNTASTACVKSQTIEEDNSVLKYGIVVLWC